MLLHFVTFGKQSEQTHLTAVPFSLAMFSAKQNGAIRLSAQKYDFQTHSLIRFGHTQKKKMKIAKIWKTHKLKQIIFHSEHEAQTHTKPNRPNINRIGEVVK